MPYVLKKFPNGLYNDDCFNVFPLIKDKSVDLFVLDLPYSNKKFGNCTACKWDTPIDLKEMWKEIKRIMKPNATIVHFCNTKFGWTLIESNPKWFRYDLIWKKSRKVGFLSANKMPLRQHENIYVFKDKQGTYNPQKTEGKPYNKTNTGNNNEDKCAYGRIDRSNHLEGEEHRAINKGDRHPTSIIEMEADHENIYIFSNEEDDIDLVRNNELRDYSKKVYKYIGKSLKTINKELGHRKAEHFFYFKTSQFGLPIEKTYNELIEKYNIDKMEGFKTYEEMKDLEELTTYNPQKTEGKPYKSKERIEGEGVYIKDTYKRTATEDTTKRHPTSIIDNTILEYKNPHKTIHRTQKPVDLLEWLIKTYSNENDTVMDFCMGSGTAGVACKNLNRKFIGVEKDKEMFEKAKDRIEK